MRFTVLLLAFLVIIVAVGVATGVLSRPPLPPAEGFGCPVRQQQPESESDAEVRVILAKAAYLRDQGDPMAGRVLPFATTHDVEPVAELQVRCNVGALTQRDVDALVASYSRRLHDLAAPTTATEAVQAAAAALSARCVRRLEQSLDRPPGPRDPGYAMPHAAYGLAKVGAA